MSRLNRRNISEWLVIGVVVGVLWLAATGEFGFWPQAVAVWPLLILWILATIALVRGAALVVREFRRGWREGGRARPRHG